MPSLQELKHLFLRMAAATGLSSLVLHSKWRQQRLLILCYHGVSLEDEHHWNAALYLSPQLFRERLQHLRDRACNVLPLGKAIDLLYRGELPPRSVAITFDDGFYDFYAVAWPALREFGMPATVYLTTYYVTVQHPIFDVGARYVAWKSRAREIEWPEIFGPGARSLGGAHSGAVASEVIQYCFTHDFDAREKFEALDQFAQRLGVDLQELRRRRILHLMTPAEVSEIAAQGCDIQLHTHRHRVSRSRERFVKEIEDNRAYIRSFTSRTAQHFCYPGGFWLDDFPQWLRECGVVSATTCDTGLAMRRNNTLMLPRLLDTTVSREAFDGWITGIADIISRHAVNKSSGQLFQDESAAGAGVSP